MKDDASDIMCENSFDLTCSPEGLVGFKFIDEMNCDLPALDGEISGEETVANHYHDGRHLFASGLVTVFVPDNLNRKCDRLR